jgi:hypothetical protein
MTKKKSERHWVLLARPVIQTLAVDVRARDRDEAVDKAKKKAAKISDHFWQGEFRPGDYGIDALTVLSDSDFEPDEVPGEYMSECADDFRYMLLKANIDSGEGVLLVEPWLRDSGDPLLAADLLKDWNIAAEHLYHRAAEMWIDSLEEKSKELAPKTSAKVIHLAPHIERKLKNKPERDE